MRAILISAMVLLVCVLGLLKYQDAKAAARQNPVDATIKSCRDLAVAQSHLRAAFHVVTEGYETIPGQKDPAAKIEGIETPEKVEQFMAWYADDGHDEMFILGQMCQTQIRVKSGEKEATEAGYLIAKEELRNAEFFADKLMKQCTGKSLYKISSR